MNRWMQTRFAAVSSWRGQDLPAFRVRSKFTDPDRGPVVWCVFDGDDTRGLSDSEVTNARPLVLLDPEDRSEVETLLLKAWPVYENQEHRVQQMADDLQRALRTYFDPEPAPDTEGELVHCVMYRDGRMGTLCDSGAYGLPVLFTAVTEKATCPGCRKKLDGGKP